MHPKILSRASISPSHSQNHQAKYSVILKVCTNAPPAIADISIIQMSIQIEIVIDNKERKSVIRFIDERSKNIESKTQIKITFILMLKIKFVSIP